MFLLVPSSLISIPLPLEPTAKRVISAKIKSSKIRKTFSLKNWTVSQTFFYVGYTYPFKKVYYVSLLSCNLELTYMFHIHTWKIPTHVFKYSHPLFLTFLFINVTVIVVAGQV